VMNLPRIWKKGKWLILIIMISLLLSFAYYSGLERDNLTFVEIWLRDILAPLESGATTVFNKIAGITGYFTGYGELIKERDDLQKKVAELTKEIDLLREEQLENVRLKKLLVMKEDMAQQWQMTAANVIGRDINNWYHSIIIDRGSSDGLKKDMVVINYDGLVGRIISVSKNTAEVLLLLDRDCATGALVQLSRASGIIEGTGSEEYLRMVHLPHDAEVRENQLVLTSGLGGVFPAGLRIGFITEIIVEPNGLMKQAQVKPFVDFEHLEEVLVLTTQINEVDAQ
jgi:rod shape-determining protein MreC